MKSGRTLKSILLIALALIAAFGIYTAASHHHHAAAPSVYQSDSSSMSASDPGKIISYDRVPYGNRSCEYFHLFIPENVDKEHASLILFVHGGGWRHGECEDFLPQCREYASMGFVTATINYSVLSSDTPEVTFDFMMKEFTKCIAEIKEICSEDDITLTGMAPYGYSAGGHLALLYAYSMDEISPVPIKTVFALAPPTDFNLASWTESSYWENEDEIAGVISLASGKDIDGDIIRHNPNLAEEFAVLSPLTFIDEDTVPSALAHGSRDITVPKVHSDLVVENLKKCGIPYSYVVFENSTHLLENDPERMIEWDITVQNFAEKYLINDIGQTE